MGEIETKEFQIPVPLTVMDWERTAAWVAGGLEMQCGLYFTQEPIL